MLDRTDDARNGAVTLTLVGDTNLQDRDDPAQAFVHVRDLLDRSDVLFGHLEGPLSMPSDDPLMPDVAHKQAWRHSDPRMVDGLKAAGFHAMSFASNVTYPARAAVDTATVLQAAGIAGCGGGRTLEEARRPAIVERHGVRFGFLSYTSVFWPVGHAAAVDRPGVATIKATASYEPHRRVHEMPGVPPIVITTPDPVELAAMVADVRALRPQVDVIVLSCHWGLSGSDRPIDYQRAIGRAALDAGADLVIGHHPHEIQGMELWNGKPIFYSLGNFAFDWTKMRGRHLDGIALVATVRNRSIVDITIVPVQRGSDNLVRSLDPTDGAGHAIIARFQHLSEDEGGTIELADRGALLRLDRARVTS